MCAPPEAIQEVALRCRGLRSASACTVLNNLFDMGGFHRHAIQVLGRSALDP